MLLVKRLSFRGRSNGRRRTTVFEALQISGVLRLHNTSRDVINVFVEEVSGQQGDG